MKLKEKYGEWACVAGAAEGLGAAFSTGLAKRGFNLILIDKDHVKLTQLRQSLIETYKIEVETLHLDLSHRESVSTIITHIKECNCRFLAYNAAYGPVKPFLSNTEEELDLYINVNASTTIHLVHGFAKMYREQRAGILLISSLAGFRGTQYVIPYAATKAFIWNLAEGLYYEFKGTKLDISVSCLGPVDTPNYRSTGPKKSFISPKSMDPKSVAEETLNRYGKQLFIFPGAATRFAHFMLTRILPRRLASGIHNATMNNMYKF